MPNSGGVEVFYRSEFTDEIADLYWLDAFRGSNGEPRRAVGKRSGDAAESSA